LDADEVINLGLQETPSFSDSDECSEISNMFFNDLTNFEQKVDEVIDTIKLIVTEFQMPKPLRKEIKKMLKLVIENKRSSDGDNIISVWEALSGMLYLFAETIVGKTYNKGVIKNPKTKKMIQLSES